MSKGGLEELSSSMKDVLITAMFWDMHIMWAVETRVSALDSDYKVSFNRIVYHSNRTVIYSTMFHKL